MCKIRRKAIKAFGGNFISEDLKNIAQIDGHHNQQIKGQRL